MNNLLYDEHPLEVNPTLATLIGLNEAIILQQIHYWLIIKQKNDDKDFNREGHWWVYNTLEQWAEQFPFWSMSTIRRAIKNLEGSNLLISGSFNKMGYDRTKWYSINYDALKNLKEQEVFILNKCRCSEQTAQDVQIEPTNTIDFPLDFNKDFLKCNNGTKPQRVLSKSSEIILEKQIRKICSTEYPDLDVDEIVYVFEYYFAKYQQKTGHSHPQLKNENISKLIGAIEYGIDMMTIMDKETYTVLIDQHFETNYDKGTDWNINHFLTEGILTNRYYETCY